MENEKQRKQTRTFKNTLLNEIMAKSGRKNQSS